MKKTIISFFLLLMGLFSCNSYKLIVPYHKYVHTKRGVVFENLFYNKRFYFLPLKKWSISNDSSNNKPCISLLKTENLKKGFVTNNQIFNISRIDSHQFSLSYDDIGGKDSFSANLYVTPVKLSYVEKKHNYLYPVEEANTYGERKFLLKLEENKKRKVSFSFRVLQFHTVAIKPLKKCDIKKK